MSDFNASGAYEGSTIDLDTIAGGGTVVPGNTKYVTELASVTGVAASKGSGKPMVTAVFEIKEGDYEGLELNKYYSMIILAPRKPGGKPFAPGLYELRADLTACGYTFPSGKQFPTKGGFGDQDKAAALLGKALRGKRVEIYNAQEPRKNKETKEIERNEDGSVVYTTRPRIIGLAGGGVSVSNNGEIEL